MGSSPSTLTDCLNAAALNDPLYNCSAFDLKKKKENKRRGGGGMGSWCFTSGRLKLGGFGGGVHLRALASLEVTVPACTQIIPTYSGLCPKSNNPKNKAYFLKKKRRKKKTTTHSRVSQFHNSSYNNLMSSVYILIV